MHLMRQKIDFIHSPYKNEDEMIRFLEERARTCYQSYDKTTPDSGKRLIKMIINKGHLSVLEHATITARIITNRAVSHQLVRHRTGIAISQESQRYCTYKENVVFIIPERKAQFFIENNLLNEDQDWSVGRPGMSEDIMFWLNSCYSAEYDYNKLLNEYKWPAEDARGVLGNDVKTVLDVTCNIREWRHILQIRTQNNCMYNMRILMRNLLKKFQEKYPVLFEDITY